MTRVKINYPFVILICLFMMQKSGMFSFLIFTFLKHTIFKRALSLITALNYIKLIQTDRPIWNTLSYCFTDACITVHIFHLIKTKNKTIKGPDIVNMDICTISRFEVRMERNNNISGMLRDLYYAFCLSLKSSSSLTILSVYILSLYLRSGIGYKHLFCS